MVWQAFVADAVASEFGGGGQGTAGAVGGAFESTPSSAISGVESATRINVSPVGINLGEILKPFTESAFNGGAGFTIPSRVSQHAMPQSRPAGSFAASLGRIASGGDNAAMMILIGAAAVVAVIMVARSRRR